MHSLFIVPLTERAWFDEQAEALGNNGPALVCCLSENGQAPATHGWCAVTLSPVKEQEIQDLLDANPSKSVDWTKYDQFCNSSYPFSRLEELGLKIIQPDL